MTRFINTNTSENLHNTSKKSLLSGNSYYDKKARELALKYYKTDNLKKLTPYQLDKLTTWVTGYNPNKLKDKNRTMGRYLKGKL